MRRGALLLILALWGCVARPEPVREVSTEQAPVAEADVVRRGDVWTADYRFDRDAPVWVLARSPLARVSEKPWRPESWTIETPGVRLDRRGRYDILVAEGGGAVPRHVRVRFKPFSKDIETDYDPALVFTDGSVALFDQQFKIFPLSSADEAAKLPIDYSAVPAAAAPTRTIFRDAAGKVFHAGTRQSSVMLEDAGAYVLFGPARPIVTQDMATIIDPQLPAWLHGFLARSIPSVLARYAETLGPPPPTKPTVMVSWNGPTSGLTSMGGSVLPGLVVMTFEGEGILKPNSDVGNDARAFVAHEGAHFWLGQIVAYEASRDAWITEGGADLLAIRTVAALDPSYDARARLQRAIDECVKLLGGGSVAGAHERNAPRTHYGCGTVFGLAAEAVSGKSFPDYVRPLIDANREDKVLTRAEWLAALEQTGGREAAGKIAALLDEKADDPKAAVAGLFTTAGVPHRLAEDGTPTLQ